jgi:hypothetical protein
MATRRKIADMKAGKIPAPWKRPEWQAAFDEVYSLFTPARREIEAAFPATTPSVQYYGILARFDALAADTSAYVANKLTETTR